MKTICTRCPERCILTDKIRTCAKIGSKIWLDRSLVICRTCPNIEENCVRCTRIGNTPLGIATTRDEMEEEKHWDIISNLLWADYKQRHPEWKQHQKIPSPYAANPYKPRK